MSLNLLSVRKLLSNIWNDEQGFVVSAELVIITTILVLSAVVGLTELAYAVNHELVDMANRIESHNPDKDRSNSYELQETSPRQEGTASLDVSCELL